MVTPDEGGGGGGAPPAALSAEERAELTSLREQVGSYKGVLERLDPFADQIKRIVDDEGYRTFIGDVTKTYDEDQQHRKPVLSAEMQALRDEILGEIKPVKDLVETHNRNIATERETRKRAVFAEGRPIIEAYLERHPNMRGNAALTKVVSELETEAVDSGRPFKECWDNFMAGFVPEQQRNAPPRQQRARDAETGIPARQEREPGKSPDDKPKSIKEAFMLIHNRDAGKRA